MASFKITVDTNTLPVEHVLIAARGLTVDVAVTSVTARAVEGTKLEPELYQLHVLPELLALGESALGVGVFALGDAVVADLFESTLAIITNGAFPRSGSRSNLTPAQRHQMRDALIFCTHVREGRDIFVTNDVSAFGVDGSPQRRRFAQLSTRIMTLVEFERFCAAQRDST